MNAIFKKDNVYVYVNGDFREGVNPNEVEEFIFDDKNKRNASLYGGRVKIGTTQSCVNNIWRNHVTLEIDGITISIPKENNSFINFGSYFSITEVTAFLNQIENLGIETFLDNYKKQTQELKVECEKKAEVLKEELTVEADVNKAKELSGLLNFIRRLSFLIFELLLHLNAGLDNQDYIDAYDAITSLYF